MVDLERIFGFRRRRGEQALRDAAHAAVLVSRALQHVVDRRGIGGGSVRPFLAVLPFLFERHREKRAVAPQRTHYGKSRLVFAELGRAAGGDFGIAGVDGFVLKKPGEVAVPLVVARARHDVDRAAGRAAELGAEDGARHAELAHHLDAHRHAVAAGGLVAVVDAVDGEAVVAPAHAAKSKAAVGHGATQAGERALRVGPVRSRDAGRHQHEVQEVAVRGRAFLDALGAQRGARGSGAGFHRSGLRLDLDRFGHRGGLQFNALQRSAAQRNGDTADDGRGKAFLLHADAILAAGQTLEQEAAVGAGNRGTLPTRFLLGERDRGAGHRGPGFVHDDALQRATHTRGLRPGGRAEQDQKRAK